MRFRYSTTRGHFDRQLFDPGKERFDKCITEKEVPNKQEFLEFVPRLCDFLKKKIRFLNSSGQT